MPRSQELRRVLCFCSRLVRLLMPRIKSFFFKKPQGQGSKEAPEDPALEYCWKRSTSPLRSVDSLPFHPGFLLSFMPLSYIKLFLSHGVGSTVGWAAWQNSRPDVGASAQEKPELIKQNSLLSWSGWPAVCWVQGIEVNKIGVPALARVA